MLFTKFDFEDKWGNPCNPTTAAQIANGKTKNLVAAEDIQPIIDEIQEMDLGRYFETADLDALVKSFKEKYKGLIA